MGSLREENYNQNLEIASLKATVQVQNKTINQHDKTIKELMIDDHRMIKSDRPALSAGKSRRKRPAQLIPISNFSGERKGGTDQPNRKVFYGPPTNCSDLSRLVYTLNGFYLIKKPKNDEKIAAIDTIYCAFQQEGTYNPSLVEKPVIPSPFTSPLFPNHAFLTPMLPIDDDFYFLSTAIRNKKDHSGVLTFDQSFHNKGSSFDGKTGYFKAPRHGIYHFVYETEFGSSGNSVGIYMNDALVANPSSSISQNLKSINLQVTIKLKFRDSVCFKAKIKPNSNNNVEIGPEVFIESVMGFLLKPTFF